MIKNKKFLSLFGCVLLLLSSIASLAQAQTIHSKDEVRDKPRWQVGGFANMRDAIDNFGPPALTRTPIILEALALTEDQKGKIRELNEAIDKERRDALTKALSNGAGKEGGFDREGMLAAEASLRDMHQATLVDILGPAKFKRFRQIALQVEGPMAVTWPEVQDSLNMDPGQRSKVLEIRDEYRAERRKITLARNKIFVDFNKTQRGTEERKVATQKMLEEKALLFDKMHAEEENLRAKAVQRIARVLTRNQERIFNKLQGDPIDISELLRPGGGSWRPEEFKKYEEDRKAKSEGS
jgi:hypothetical protein